MFSHLFMIRVESSKHARGRAVLEVPRLNGAEGGRRWWQILQGAWTAGLYSWFIPQPITNILVLVLTLPQPLFQSPKNIVVWDSFPLKSTSSVFMNLNSLNYMFFHTGHFHSQEPNAQLLGYTGHTWISAGRIQFRKSQSRQLNPYINPLYIILY